VKALIPDPAIEPTISVARAAKIIGVGTRTAYDLVKRDEWPAIKVGGTIRINTARFLAKYGSLIDHTGVDAA
jgi:excisionase family DNA binding protein